MLVFVGFILTFGPSIHPWIFRDAQRYAVYPPEFQTLNILSSAGAPHRFWLSGILSRCRLFNSVISIRPGGGPRTRGEPKGLEWTSCFAGPPLRISM